MRYLEFASRALAEARSAAEASARGCGTNPQDVTDYWWSVESDGTNACLLIAEGDEGSLSADERSRLTSDEPAWIAARRVAAAAAMKG